MQGTTIYLFPSVFSWTIGTTGTGGIFPAAQADTVCVQLDDMLDPSTSGHTGGRVGKEQVGLKVGIKLVRILWSISGKGRSENWKKLQLSESGRETGSDGNKE